MIPLVDDLTLLLLGIMIISGIIGGLTGFFLLTEVKRPRAGLFWGHLLLGVVAALTVPMFLSIVSSSLLSASSEKPLNMLVLAGYALIFALFSKPVFENISAGRLRRTGSGRDDDRRIRPDNNRQKVYGRLASLAGAGISEDEFIIMRAVAAKKESGHSLAGLIKDSGLAKDIVNEAVSALITKGMVKLELNGQNRLRLYLTDNAVRAYFA